MSLAITERLSILENLEIHASLRARSATDDASSSVVAGSAISFVEGLSAQNKVRNLFSRCFRSTAVIHFIFDSGT